MNDVAKNIADVRGRMKAAAVAAGRGDDAITLVAVSKTQPDEAIEAALAAGQRVFGENRVQEAKAHWAWADGGRRERFADLRLHLIGPLQTNKVRDAVALFDVIETVDRADLARKLAAEMARQNRPLPCFVQVNTGGEAQKAGVAVRDADMFVDFCRRECGLLVEGLMCIPPVDEDPVPHFRMLRTLARENDLRYLSMGMSGDYEVAIAEGATHVRVGTALFGARE
jgi:hypothetical protein